MDREDPTLDTSPTSTGVVRRSGPVSRSPAERRRPLPQFLGEELAERVATLLVRVCKDF